MGGVTVTTSEVHTYCEVDLTATQDVVQEGIARRDLQERRYSNCIF